MTLIESICEGQTVDLQQEDAKIVGDIGEVLVKGTFCGQLSKDYWDSIKDGIDFFGQTFEVKTQARMNVDNTLSVAAKQATKCLNVDRLIFVEYDNTKFIKIWQCIDINNHIRYRTQYGKDMIKWYIKDMISLAVISSVPLTNLIRKHSNAYYNFEPLRGLILNEN
jgi:hypothetical protein